MEKEKKMKSSLKLLAAAALATGIAYQAPAQDKVREISILEDTAPNAMTTKVYELKHTKAADLAPIVQNAVNYMDDQSKVDRCNFKAEGKQLLFVSMWNEMIPNVDGIIKALDRPGFDGRADYNFEYYMEYRSGANLTSMLSGADNMFTTNEATYYEDEGYVIRWRDSKSDGNGFVKIIKQLDKPVPQVNLIFSVYEVNDDDLKDVGVDYISWMNGIDQTLQVFSHQRIRNLDSNSYKKHTGKYSDFYFDWSFVRLMQQKSLANVATTGYATVRNRGEASISFTPSLQSLVKDDDHDDFVTSDDTTFTMDISETLFYLNEQASGTGTINFDWALEINSAAGTTPNGDTIMNTQKLHSTEQMGAGSEKVLTSFVREHDVTQMVGVPYLCEIPVLKYIFGAETTSKAKTHVIVTVRAESVDPEGMSNSTAQAEEAIANAAIQ